MSIKNLRVRDPQAIAGKRVIAYVIIFFYLTKRRDDDEEC